MLALEVRPPVVSQQYVVAQFECDLCDTDYIGYTDYRNSSPSSDNRESEILSHWNTH